MWLKKSIKHDLIYDLQSRPLEVYSSPSAPENRGCRETRKCNPLNFPDTHIHLHFVSFVSCKSSLSPRVLFPLSILLPPLYKQVWVWRARGEKNLWWPDEVLLKEPEWAEERLKTLWGLTLVSVTSYLGRRLGVCISVGGPALSTKGCSKIRLKGNE